MRSTLGLLSITGLLLLAGCGGEDPRLPEKLYQDALKLSQDGKVLEAKLYMELIASRYPETPAGRQALENQHYLEDIYRRENMDKVREVRSGMRRVASALKRYHSSKGEYPAALSALVPEYLEALPLTPWGHPFLYRAYVSQPIEDVKDRRGRISQQFNTKRDRYNLACLGVDALPGGKGLASDTVLADGEFLKLAVPKSVPLGQPVR